MKTTRHAATNCPECGYLLDASSHPGSAVPEPGDLTICGYCTAVLTYEPGLTVRPMTPKELAALDQEARTEIEAAQRIVRQMNNQRRTP